MATVPDPIVFGTSGWRAVIAEQFTFAHVRLVVRVIGDYLAHQGMQGRPVVVGYDTRFLSDRFAREAAGVLAAQGWDVLIANRDVPTPVVSHAILDRRAAGAVNITASHNPPEYNGVKFSPAWGGPALPDTTRWIENRIAARRADGAARENHTTGRRGAVEPFDPREAYLTHLRTVIDSAAIRAAKLRVAIDVMHGTARGYLDAALRADGCEVTVLHEQLDPLFGGSAPDPSERRLTELAALMREGRYHLGLATDGDADRFGVLDADGTYITANEVLALAFQYLIETRGANTVRASRSKGGVARSVATSHLVDLVAARYGRAVYETGVGFKYIGRLIADGKLVVGGEEAQGLAIGGHVPDKDGIIACLLLAEMVARTGKPLRRQLEELTAAVGARHYRRIDHALPAERVTAVLARLRHVTSIGGFPIIHQDEVEGIKKWYFDESSWMIIRPSGTEPVVRLYAEAPTIERMEALMKAGVALIGADG
ncbi:MAG: phosphoglucomutase/phosphomannomutase family protein [Nitrospirae bacterium]|nr:phosphoglucomutase/phosphomannomutase family protein [Nitrospirota bacterium]